MRLPNPEFQASNDDVYAVERLSYQSHLTSENLYKLMGCSLTFGDVCDKLLIKEAVRVKRREFASRSLVMLKSRLSRHVLPFFGARSIDQIASADVEEFLTYLYEFNLSDITINQYFNALRKVLTHAFEGGKYIRCVLHHQVEQNQVKIAIKAFEDAAAHFKA